MDRERQVDPATAPRIELSEAFRAGSVSSGTAADFGRIVSVALDDLGRAYVADGQARQVVVLSPSGDVEEVLGRSGKGPGEFSIVSWVDVSPSGDVWVMDPLQRRLTVFAAGTREITTVSYPASGYSTSIPWSAVLQDDTTLFVVEDRLTPGASKATVHQYRLREGALFPLATLRLPPISLPESVSEEHNGIRMRSAPPFAPRTAVVPSLSVTWRVHTRDFRVERLDTSGQVDRVVTLSLLGMTVPTRVRDSIAASLSLELDRVPTRIPPIISLNADETGRVWVGVTEDGATISTWHVFDRDGRHLAAVVPPEGVRFVPGQMALRGNKVVGVIEDSLSVQSVVTLLIPTEGLAGG